MSEPLILTGDMPLVVPFNDRQRAKDLGAAPHYEEGKFKAWIAPQGSDLMKFKDFWSPSFRQWYREQFPDKAEEKIEGSRLSAVLLQVKQAIESNLSQAIWIQSEIIGVHRGNHTYLEIADYDDDGNELAKGRASIFAGQKAVLQAFEQATGMPIEPGMKVLFRASVSFHEKFGLSFTIVEFEPRYTVGDMEAKLIKIKKQLLKEGILEQNKRLQEPELYSKVAVIAPANAAGLGDFRTQADKLVKHDLCSFDYYEATFQGKDALSSISIALDNVTRKIFMGEKYDAVVVIRGGGDKAGLYALNEYEIARRVCTIPVPVIVGIGHERDSTILDEIACVRQPTPSLVISSIVSNIVNSAQEARKNAMLIKAIASDAVSSARRGIEISSHSITTVAKEAISEAKSEIKDYKGLIVSESKMALEQARSSSKEKVSQLFYQDPSKIVNQGYGIVRNGAGKVSGDAKGMSPGETLSITMRDGHVDAVVQSVELKEGN